MPSARKLGKRADQRRAMFRGMVTLLLDKGRIETTLARAKELKRVADKMVTIGKKNTLAAKRMAFAYITKEEVVKKLFDQIAPSFDGRNGGYTRVLKLGPRRGDGAEMAIIELVNYTPKDKKEKKKEQKAQEKKEEKETKAKKDTKKEEPVKKETKTTKTTTKKAAEVETPKETTETAEVKKPRAPRKPKAVEAETVAAAEEPKEAEAVEEVEKTAEIESEAEEVTDVAAEEVSE